MKQSYKLIPAVALALLIAAPSALAQTPEVSPFPVTEPIEVSGTVVQPGDYTIKVVRSFQNRNTVQILDRDGQVVVTALTIPHAISPGETVPNTKFVFYPAEEGRPRALRTWFARDPAASQGGHDFVYEESRARELARLTDHRIVSYRDQTAVAEIDTTTLNVVTPQQTVETYTYTPPAAAPLPPPATSAARETTTVQMAESRPIAMPRTASNTPLVALLGLLAIAGAVVIRVARG